MLGTKVALVKSIYISGNKIFLVRIEKLIGALKKLKLPLKVSESFENQTNEKRDDGVLIIELLEPLDFDFEMTPSGWVRFIHPELRVEFLVPRYGPTSDDPRSIP